MPQIYSGDGIGMTGGADPDSRRDFPGGFPGDTQDAFTQAGRTPQQQDIFAWTSDMLTLRQSHEALKSGIEQNLFADRDGFAFVRALDAGGCAQNGKSDHVQLWTPPEAIIQAGILALAGLRAYRRRDSTLAKVSQTSSRPNVRDVDNGGGRRLRQASGKQ
jgi:glycosidase